MSYLKNNFNGGEVGASLRYRADLAKYANAEELLENFFVLPQGGVENRPGMQFLTDSGREAGQNTRAVRLIPFQFSNTEKFCLELGREYVKIIAADGNCVVLWHNRDGNWFPVVSENKLWDIRYAQKNDIVFLVHPEIHPMTLKRTGSSWKITKLDLVGGPWNDTGEDEVEGVTMTPSAKSGDDVTITASADYFTEDMVYSKIRLRYFRKKNGFIHTFTGNANISSTKSSGVFGRWTFRSSGSWVGTLTLLRSTDGGTTWSEYRSWESNADNNADESDYESERGVLYSCKFTGWQNPPAGTLYECRVVLSHDDYMHEGWGKIFNVQDARRAQVEVLYPFYSTAATEEWSLEAWNDIDGYPSIIGFHSGDRLVFGATKKSPQTLWFSAVGDYNNFTEGTRAEDAITVTLNTGRFNDIRWMCEFGGKLYLGCANGISRLESTDDAPIAPGKVKVTPSGVTGTAPLAAVPVGEAILFVRRGARSLLEFSYQYSDDVYRTPEMSILNPDILDSGVKELHLRQSPYPMLLCLRNDGVLCCFTYNRPEEVMAWCRITAAADGKIESVCVLDTDDKEDEIYLAVNRGGNRTIEKLSVRSDDPAAACYLDCAVERSSQNPTTTFTVAPLAGKTVTVCANGVACADITVDVDGALTLPVAATHIWAGFPYVSTMRTLPLEVAQGVQGSFGSVKRVPELILKTLNTYGGEVSTLDGRRQLLARRELPCQLGGPIDAQPRDEAITMFNTPGREQQIEIRQTLPLPMTLLALMAETE